MWGHWAFPRGGGTAELCPPVAASRDRARTGDRDRDRDSAEGQRMGQGRGWGRADLAAPRPWERAKPPCLLAAPPLFGRPAPPPASAQRVGLRLHRVPEPGLCPCSPGQNSHPDLAAHALVLFVPSPVHKELVQPGAVNICWQSRAHREEDAIVQEPTVTF